MEKTLEKKKKKFSQPHAYFVLFLVICMAMILTWVIPAGNFERALDEATGMWGDRIFEKCGIGRDERGDGGKTLEIRGKRRLSARDGGANYQQS